MRLFKLKAVRTLITYVVILSSLIFLGTVYETSYLMGVSYLHKNIFRKNAILLILREKYPPLKKGEDTPEDGGRKEMKPETVVVKKEFVAMNRVFRRTVKTNHDALVRICRKYSITNHIIERPISKGKPLPALDPFFTRLAEVAAGKNIPLVKIALFGDSIIAGDRIPKYMRRMLKKQFRYGGPGYICAAQPFRYYIPQDIDVDAHGWMPLRITEKHRSDRHAGMNGYAFIASNHPAWTVFRTKNQKAYPFDMVSIYYLAQPEGGSFSYAANHLTKRKISTASEEPGVRRHIESCAPSNAITLSNHSDGAVRIYGAEFTRFGGGITFNAFPLHGGSIGILLLISKESWVEQVRLFNPDLIIFMFGVNISKFKKLPIKMYQNQLSSIIKRSRAAVPGCPVMFIGPLGLPEKQEGKLVVMPIMREIMSTQRISALENGCAYLDLYSAVGGDGAIPAVYLGEGGDRLVTRDLIHLTETGAKRVSEILFSGLMMDFKEFLKRRGYVTIDGTELISPAVIK